MKPAPASQCRDEINVAHCHTCQAAVTCHTQLNSHVTRVQQPCRIFTWTDPGAGNKGSPRQAAACSRKSDLDPPLCAGGTILCTSCTILCTICPFVAGGTAHNVLQCHISYTRRPRPPDTAYLRNIARCLRSGNTFHIRDKIKDTFIFSDLEICTY